jgi:hypothetical protein
MKLPSLVLLAAASALPAAGQTKPLHSFSKSVLTQEFWAEGAHVGDFNKDGKKDIVAGPYWYAGPDFKQRHRFYEATQTFKVKAADGSEKVVPGFEGGLGKNNAYSNNFLSYVHDVNADGWDDVVVMGFPGEQTWWYENPKNQGAWPRHMALDVTDNESPTFLDITGDGKPEVICSSKGAYGWSEPDSSDPTKPWSWRAISPNKNYHKYTHGLGVGDVNGDGRMDLLEKDGWWEQPASLAGYPLWKHHPYAFGTGGAQMYAYDVDGDGRNDVITSLAAHGYGLTWFRNVDDGKGGIGFEENTFMNKEPGENRYGVKFSQLHAIDLQDVDGDGLKDIVTGKRFWAHGPTGDPEPGAPAVLYWFRLVRHADKSVDFVPYRIDDDSGVGTQVLVADVNGDRLLDVVVGNKKGVFVHVHQVRQVGADEWTAAQPKPLASAK